MVIGHQTSQSTFPGLVMMISVKTIVVRGLLNNKSDYSIDRQPPLRLLPRDLVSQNILWTLNVEEWEENAQVVRTWGGKACPSPDRWRRVLDKDNL